MPRPHPHPLLLAAALAILPAGPASPAAAQSIVGRVVAGPSSSPVAAATVRLLDAELRPLTTVRTGPDGRYRLPTGGEGRFWVLVEAPGYAATLSDALPVRGVGLVDHSPTLALLDTAVDGEPVAVLEAPDLARACGPRSRSEPGGIVVGQVREPGGETLRGAWVTAEWWAGSVPVREEVRSGPDGLYVFCAVPAHVEVRVRAATTDRVGPAVRVAVREDAVHRVDVDLPAVTSPLPGRVLGRVVDVGTGAGVASALLALDDLGLRLWTDANGHFALDAVPPGVHTLRVDHVAYAGREIGLVVSPDGSHGLHVPLAREAIELEPVVVTVRGPRWYQDMRGFQRRMLLAAGAYLTRDDIVRAQPTRLVDLLREVPGVRVDAAGRVPVIHMRGRRCDPDLVVDRVRRRDRGLLTELRGMDLEAVEVYRSAAENPGDLVSPGACGAILVWTRRALV